VVFLKPTNQSWRKRKKKEEKGTVFSLKGYE